MAEYYDLKHSAEQIDEQIDRVIDGSVVTENADKIEPIIEDNTLSALDPTSKKPVDSKGITEAIDAVAVKKIRQNLSAVEKDKRNCG